jgi:sugar O-acyltransferase (sialic acid O-acetyltransferase NeuD family)
MQNKPEILLIGGGGHCHSVIDVIEQEGKYKIAGIIDKKELIGTRILDYKVIACDDDLEELFNTYKYAIVTVGQIKSNSLRVKLFNLIKSIGYNIPTIISPIAYVSKYANIEQGTVIHHHTLVNTNVKIGQNCIINTKALIEHDTTIEDNCHISTGVIINGGVVVEQNTFVGSNATTKEYITIKNNSFIKAGSVVK